MNESLIIDEGGHLVALIHPDFEAANSQHLSEEAIEKVMDDNLVALNAMLPAYSKVKRSIKRFLYQP